MLALLNEGIITIADDKKALNLALKDEITALEWVQANIGIFGGDNTKVIQQFYPSPYSV